MLPWKLDSFPNILISSWAKFQVLKPISHKFGKSVFPSKQFSWVEMLLLCVHSVPAYVVEKCLIEVLENLQASIQGKATYDFSWGYKARKILNFIKLRVKNFEMEWMRYYMKALTLSYLCTSFVHVAQRQVAYVTIWWWQMVLKEKKF